MSFELINVPQKGGNTTQRFSAREDFNGTSLNPATWSVVTGAGMSVTVSGGALTIAAGTVADAETVIRSVSAFKLPVHLGAILRLSQRIANQEFFVELVTADGSQGTGVIYDGTSATTAKHYCRSDLSIQTTSASVTMPTSASDSVVEIETDFDSVVFGGRVLNTTRDRTYALYQNVPQISREYHVQIRAKNGSTAPASNTNLIIDAIWLADVVANAVEIIGGRGGSASSAGLHAIPCYVTAGVIAAVTMVTNSNNRLTFTTESTTNLGASATFTGTTKDQTATGQSSVIRVSSFADVAGTIQVEQSRDGTVWRVYNSMAAPANTLTMLTSPIINRYVRVSYVNGGSAQTTFELNSALVGMS